MPLARAFAEGCARVVVVLTRPRSYLRSFKRDRFAYRMLRRRQRVGGQAIAALWPDMQAPRTPSLTADWLEVAAGRLEA